MFELRTCGRGLGSCHVTLTSHSTLFNLLMLCDLDDIFFKQDLSQLFEDFFSYLCTQVCLNGLRGVETQ